MSDPKGNQLNNAGEVHVEQNGNRTDIFHGSGADINTRSDGHSHTVINDGQMTYDRSETGTVYTNTPDGQGVDIPDADVTRNDPDWWDNN